MGDNELPTARLVLRPLQAIDADELHALWTAPGVRRYLWDDEVIAPERTAAVVAESERLFATEGYGLWAARRDVVLPLPAPASLSYCGWPSTNRR